MKLASSHAPPEKFYYAILFPLTRSHAELTQAHRAHQPSSAPTH